MINTLRIIKTTVCTSFNIFSHKGDSNSHRYEVLINAPEYVSSDDNKGLPVLGEHLVLDAVDLAIRAPCLFVMRDAMGNSNDGVNFSSDESPDTTGGVS